MYRGKAFLILCLSVFVIAACGGSAEFRSGSEADFDSGEAGRFNTASVAPMEPAFDEAASGANLPAAQVQERLIIRTGNLSIVVEDTDQILADIMSLAEGAGGWVVGSSVSQFGDGAKQGEITVRIPADSFNHAIEAIKEMALEVRVESTSGDDVTEDYVDLSSRLSNLEATADRVRNFLDETRNVEEALAVNEELSRLEEQIEVIKGRMQYLEQSAAFSTITVDVVPDELSQPIEVAGWRPQGIARNAVETLVGALQGLASILIWLVIVLLPLVLLFAVPIWLTARFFIRRRRSRKTADEPA